MATVSLRFTHGFLLLNIFLMSIEKRPIQYGGLGIILGHELTHGFDNTGLSIHVYQCSKPTLFNHCLTGRQYDKEGRKRQWWSDKSIQNYKNRQDCFVEQYSEYEMFGIPVRITHG